MKKEKRFEVMSDENIGGMKTVSIIRDKQTGVQYIFTIAGYAGGMTPLLDRDGKPMLDLRSE